MLRVIEGFDFMPSGLSNSERARLFGSKKYYPVPDTSGGEYPTVATGRFGFGKCVSSGTQFGSNNRGNIIPIGAALDEGYAGLACYFGSGGTSTAVGVLKFFDGSAGTPQITVVVKNLGILSVYRGDYPGGTLLGSTLPGAFQVNEWWHLGVYGLIDGTSGAVELRVNTETKLSLPSVNTKGVGSSGTFDMIYPASYMPGSSQLLFMVDDLFVNDTTGGINDGWLGNCRVMTQFVSGNSTPQNFSIGGSSPAATAWQSLLNTALDDTKYIHDGTAGDRSLFTLEAIINSPMVYGTQLSGAYRMDDATQRVVSNVLKSGATVDSGVDQYINQTYTFYKDIWELNPATGVGFTGAELNGLIVGPNVNV